MNIFTITSHLQSLRHVKKYRSAMKHTIEVTQDDIDNGERANCGRCPVARALRRHFPDSDPAVNQSVIHISDGRRWIYPPASVSKFIDSFDQKKPVSPFSFEIEIPEN